MTFRVNHESSDNPARCPYRVVVQATGREIDWINQYLDYETVRRLADHTLQSYANELLYFLRWWESVHHTDTIAEDKLTESTLLDYVRSCEWRIHRITRQSVSGTARDSASASDTRQNLSATQVRQNPAGGLLSPRASGAHWNTSG